MRKTSVEIDDQLIEQARILLGTSSIEETVNGALREVIRREEVRALAEMDGLDLSHEEIMAGAWRT